MLTSISPLGERARAHRWWLTAMAYVVGSASGGAGIGVLLGVAGSALTGPATRAAAVALVGCAALEVAGRLPHGRRQVDEDWLTRYRGVVYGFGYGAQLGLGVVTIVTSASTYAVLALALLSGSAQSGFLIGASFGVARALPLLAMAGVTTPQRLRSVGGRLAAAQRVLRPITTGGLVLAAGALVALA